MARTLQITGEEEEEEARCIQLLRSCLQSSVSEEEASVRLLLIALSFLFTVLSVGCCRVCYHVNVNIHG